MNNNSNAAKNYSLHPTLKQDTFLINSTNIADILLMNQRQMPWIIIVPNQDYYQSLLEIPINDYEKIMILLREVAGIMQELWNFDKINIASIGNMVPQIHLHLVGRFHRDVCFPKPVWGNIVPCPYDIEEKNHMLQILQQKFNEKFPDKLIKSHP